jgi:hypothetical protein
VDEIEAGFERHGWGVWAVEVQRTHESSDSPGLAPATFAAHFTPAVETGDSPAPPGDSATPPASHALRRHVLYRLAVD